MDLVLIGYTASIFAAFLAISSYTHWGVAEVHTYTIPPYLEERGYSTRTVSNQVVDAMYRIQIEVASLKETSVVVQGQVHPIGEVASYFGLVELMRAAESVFGLAPTVIELEITQNGDQAHWRIRGKHAVHGYQIGQGDVPLENPDALIDFLGLQVATYVSPFEALAFRFIQDAQKDNYETTITVASDLLLDCQKQQAWVCNNTNLRSTYLLRGMAELYSDQFTRAFDDIAAANKIGTGSALGIAFYGDAFLALGDVEAAKVQYKKAVSLDQNIGDQFIALAEGYAQGGKHRLADRRYTTAMELGQSSEVSLLGWGDSLYALGKYDAALEKYLAAEAVDPKTTLYADRIDRTLKARDDAKSLTPKKPEAVNAPGTSDKITPVEPATPTPAK